MYSADDRERDEKEIPMQALLAAALSSAGSGRTPQAGVVIRRAEVYEKWLHQRLPAVTPPVYLQCDRVGWHAAHTHYDEQDNRVRCVGVVE